MAATGREWTGCVDLMLWETRAGEVSRQGATMTSEMLEAGPALDEPLLILIPVFNDWSALGKLLDALDETMVDNDLEAGVLVVDDGSTMEPEVDPTAQSFRALRHVDIIELRRNLGHQRAIAVGLAYVEDRGTCDSEAL